MRIKNNARLERVVNRRLIEKKTSELALVQTADGDGVERQGEEKQLVAAESTLSDGTTNGESDRRDDGDESDESDEAASCTSDKNISSADRSSSNDGVTAEKFGPYEVVWEIRRDALSTTYAVRNDNIEGLLALRVFSARVTDAAQVRSIQKAATRAAELTHVNLVAVYENGIGENGAPYLVTDLVEGETLQEVYQVAKRLDIARFLDIFNQCCDALQEAHTHQLVHSNLSPNKILLQSNSVNHDLVKIIDFGMPPDPVQNAFYLSPEQRLDSQLVDAKTDIYALGCLMYEALVGRPPAIRKMTQTSLNYLHELANQYSPKSPEHNALKLLDCIIIKCLQQDPNKRFRNVRELMDALRLVNECLNGSSSRRLPPKAEKLLLFRFLDYFDKKIVIGMFTYLLIAGLSVKFTGETQLQKYIDEAQFAKRQALPVAQEYWRAAIQQAESIGKPPSLIADLHWEFADTLAAQSVDKYGKSRNEGLCKNAIAEYKRAEEYFSHGLRYRSCHLDLLKNISNLWMSIDNENHQKDQRDKVLADAKKLLAQKKYEQCAKLCSEFLTTHEDKHIAYCASSAYNEIGTTLPFDKAFPNFERALYYVNLAGADSSTEINNIVQCMNSSKVGYDTNFLAERMLEQGDLEACQAIQNGLQQGIYLNYNAVAKIQTYHDLKRTANKRGLGDPNLKNAVQPLHQALAIEEESYGMHSDALAPTLSALASCYRSCGEDKNAIAAYERLFALSPKVGSTEHTRIEIESLGSQNVSYTCEDVLNYVDLLAKHDENGKAIKLLEKSVLKEGEYNIYNPLFFRLLKAYVDAEDEYKAHYMASTFLDSRLNFATGVPVQTILMKAGSPPPDDEDPFVTNGSSSSN